MSVVCEFEPFIWYTKCATRSPNIYLIIILLIRNGNTHIAQQSNALCLSRLFTTNWIRTDWCTGSEAAWIRHWRAKAPKMILTLAHTYTWAWTHGAHAYHYHATARTTTDECDDNGDGWRWAWHIPHIYWVCEPESVRLWRGEMLIIIFVVTDVVSPASNAIWLYRWLAFGLRITRSLFHPSIFAECERFRVWVNRAFACEWVSVALWIGRIATREMHGTKKGKSFACPIGDAIYAILYSKTKSEMCLVFGRKSSYGYMRQSVPQICIELYHIIAMNATWTHRRMDIYRCYRWILPRHTMRVNTNCLRKRSFHTSLVARSS